MSKPVNGQIVVVMILCCWASSVASETPDGSAIEIAMELRDRAMAGASSAYDIVSELTTRIGPRPAGSQNMTRAKDWAIAKMKASGFDRDVVQEYSVPRWIRRRESAAIIRPYGQPLHVTALGSSVSTPLEGIDAEIALLRTYQDMLAMPLGSLRGKIAVVTQRIARTQDGRSYGALYAMRGAGAVEAAKRGAIAYLIRSFGTSSHRSPHTGAMAYAEGIAKIPAAALSNPDADQLERSVATGEPVRVQLTINTDDGGQSPAWNIVGEIVGSEAPEEVILLGAHLDSWDLGTGAVDDGAGVAIVIAAAKMIADLPGAPRRTIRVVLFGAEELGPVGAGSAYAAANTDELSKIMIASESDFGAGLVYSIGFPAAAGDVSLARAILRVLAPIGVFPAQEPAVSGGPDLGPIHARGVPAFKLFQDGTEYFDIHHTADDTLDKIDPKKLDQNVAAWAVTSYLLAQSSGRFRAPAGH